MTNTCSHLGSLASASSNAAYENTRLILREVACIPIETLQRGHGCDGIDNNCDIGALRDECNEDIFPPEIDIGSVQASCSDRVFQTSEEARECIQNAVSATDDCKPVEITTTVSGEANCQGDASVVATAIGCGNRIPEDTTVVTVPVQIDSEPPRVFCFLGSGSAQIIPATGEFVDVGLKVLATDDRSEMCGSALDVEVKIFSNELDPGTDIVVPFEHLVFDSSLNVDTRAGLYVKAEVCSGLTCISDPNPEVDDRYYTIIATATDAAGNTASSSECTVRVLAGGTAEAGGKKGKGSARARKTRRHTQSATFPPTPTPSQPTGVTGDDVQSATFPPTPTPSQPAGVTGDEVGGELSEDTFYRIRQRFLLATIKVKSVTA